MPVVLKTIGAPGVYSGTITIASDELPGGKTTSSITIYVSSGTHKFWGVVTILFGISVSWFVAIFIRNRLSRDQLMLPVLSLKARLKIIESDLETTMLKSSGFDAPETRKKIAYVRDQVLEKTELEKNGLPGQVPSPWTPPLQQGAASFQAYIARATLWTTDIEATVGGFSRVLGSSPGNPPNIVSQAWTNIDSFMRPTEPKPTDQLLTSIDAEVARLRQSWQATPAVMSLRSGISIPAESLTQLQSEIVNLTSVAWAFVFVATLAAGAYVLIFSANGAGFGTPQDFIISFLWGLGLPTAVSALNSQSGMTAFNITKPV